MFWTIFQYFRILCLSWSFRLSRTWCKECWYYRDNRFLPNHNRSDVQKALVERLHSILTFKESALNVPENLEARRRLEFFSNSLFMRMPNAPSVRKMLSFRWAILLWSLFQSFGEKSNKLERRSWSLHNVFMLCHLTFSDGYKDLHCHCWQLLLVSLIDINKDFLCLSDGVQCFYTVLFGRRDLQSPTACQRKRWWHLYDVLFEDNCSRFVSLCSGPRLPSSSTTCDMKHFSKYCWICTSNILRNSFGSIWGFFYF